MKWNCPICKQEVNAGSADFPFCGERCRLIDLGNWSSEKYVISSPADPQTNRETPEDE